MLQFQDEIKGYKFFVFYSEDKVLSIYVTFHGAKFKSGKLYFIQDLDVQVDKNEFETPLQLFSSLKFFWNETHRQPQNVTISFTSKENSNLVMKYYSGNLENKEFVVELKKVY